MKKIEAIIRTEKLEDVKRALSRTKHNHGMTVCQVLGFGKQQGFAELVRGQKVVPTLLAKVKIEMVVKDEDVEAMIELIQAATLTGEVGDGKIFISPIENVVRIRTNERGEEAL
jgi:nitrogen regulatory protein P-II 1